ncbi:hypothetical protein Ancab_002838 [Ancistrocladus abbreviatus]
MGGRHASLPCTFSLFSTLISLKSKWQRKQSYFQQFFCFSCLLWQQISGQELRKGGHANHKARGSKEYALVIPTVHRFVKPKAFRQVHVEASATAASAPNHAQNCKFNTASYCISH